MPTPVHLIWFKRDLRHQDHAPLWHAAQTGAPLLPLYIVEPSLLNAPDFDPAHWTFIHACLTALRQRLAELGQPLVVRIGEAVPVLDLLSRQLPLAHMWAHEETSNWLGFQRDTAVRAWAKNRHIPFTELPHNGVVRCLKNRDDWEAIRAERLRQPLLPPPESLVPVPANITVGRIPDHAQLRLPRDRRASYVPAGGETAAHELLHTFLQERGANYIAEISSPLTAVSACSRLSPHLAWGTLSVKQSLAATTSRQRELRRLKPEERETLGGRWQQSLNAFVSRLAWRDHFIQKLESEPEIEFEHFVRAFEGLRGHNEAKFEAWRTGQTGYPMVDACMRFLNQTGWLNFRMRAMLVSFAAYDLWLDWQEPARHLARAFMDYEPGIHYSQMQMQAGTTGNRTLRIYDPVKQGQTHDPDGQFIRAWVPELAGVPTAFVHAPWGLPRALQEKYGCVLGRDYAAPLVNHTTAVRQAKERITHVLQNPTTQAEIRAVYDKHGSRRPLPKPPRHKQAAAKSNPNQLSLFD